MREAAQHVMSALVKKAGRNIAPYLKNMMGAWLLNQCDTYPTVASAALSAFSNSFSPHKQKDVWSFSKDTILEVFDRFSNQCYRNIEVCNEFEPFAFSIHLRGPQPY